MSRPPDNDWLAALRPKFREITAERLRHLRAERAALPQASRPDLVLKQIRSIAHTISGTADNFGFDRLGAVAQTVEAECDQTLAGGDTADAVAQFRQLLRHIDMLIEEASRVLDAE